MSVPPVNALLADRGVPELNGPATILWWSDRQPGTVVEIIETKTGPHKGQPRKVRVRYDDWKVVSGSEHDGSARYEYSRNEENEGIWFTWTGKRWKSEGGGQNVQFGERSRYHDPHI